MMGGWTLDDRLAADTVPVVALALCELRLMDEARWPWLVLVPRRPAARELLDLAPADQALLLAELDRAARALRACVRCDKLNIAALGNVVAQLHVHVIARTVDDPAWPRPVWGVGERQPFQATERESLVSALQARL